MLWVTDLSLQDPFYVLPILWGRRCLSNRKLRHHDGSDTGEDHVGAPDWSDIPVRNFPSGLVLYWVTNNVLTISQQFITDRFLLNDKALASAGAEQSSSPNA